jgi:hypothetical protein
MRGDEQQHADRQHDRAEADGDPNWPAQMSGWFPSSFKFAYLRYRCGVNDASRTPPLQRRLPGFRHFILTLKAYS